MPRRAPIVAYIASTINSDIVPGEAAGVIPTGDGEWITFRAPVEGSVELLRVATADGALERLTTGHHSVSTFDQVDLGRSGRDRTAWLRSSPTELSDLWVRDGTSGAPRRLTDLNREALDEVELRAPVERSVTVDGRRIQGWFLRGAARVPAGGTAARQRRPCTARRPS